MSEANAYKVDRTGWPAGPWDDEPEDRLEWRAEGTPRIACLMVRPDHGAWCGYVAVPPGHPWHGKTDSWTGDERLPEDAWDATHGGVTYSAKCHGTVCHVPDVGESDDVWWVGFDCMHSMDYAPGHEASIARIMKRDIEPEYGPERGKAYRSQDYVRSVVNRLAKAAQAAVKS